jgi:hypothetical protein
MDEIAVNGGQRVGLFRAACFPIDAGPWRWASLLALWDAMTHSDAAERGTGKKTSRWGLHGDRPVSRSKVPRSVARFQWAGACPPLCSLPRALKEMATTGRIRRRGPNQRWSHYPVLTFPSLSSKGWVNLDEYRRCLATAILFSMAGCSGATLHHDLPPIAPEKTASNGPSLHSVGASLRLGRSTAGRGDQAMAIERPTLSRRARRQELRGAR